MHIYILPAYILTYLHTYVHAYITYIATLQLFTIVLFSNNHTCLHANTSIHPSMREFRPTSYVMCSVYRITLCPIYLPLQPPILHPDGNDVRGLLLLVYHPPVNKAIQTENSAHAGALSCERHFASSLLRTFFQEFCSGLYVQDTSLGAPDCRFQLSCE